MKLTGPNDVSKGGAPPWVGNTLGEDHLNGIVPPPWTALSISAKPATIGCWGRHYEFGDITALPTQIRSQHTILLSGPIDLVLQVNGDPEPVQWTGAKQVSKPAGNAVAASIHRTAFGTVGKSTIKLTTNATVEYDGFAWFDLSFSGFPAGAMIDSLHLDIPYPSKVALYSHRILPPNDPLATTRKSYSGLADRQPGVPGFMDWVESFIAFWWLGDNDAGLQWTVEDASAWPNWNKPDSQNHIYPIELRKIAASPKSIAHTLQRLRLIRGQTLPAGWKFEFGLQATPVKPLPADWRKWRPRSNRPADDAYNDPLAGKVKTVRAVEVGGQDPDRDWTVAFGYPEIDPTHATDHANTVSVIHQAGGKVAQYELLTEMSSFSTEWPANSPSWSAIPGNGCYTCGAYPAGASFCITDPTSSFADFIVWKTNEFLLNSKVDGFYHDQTVLYFKMPGWIDGANVPQLTYPIRAYRNLYRRIYTIAKKTVPDGFLLANMAGEMNMAVLAYEDACLEGEQLQMRLPVTNYKFIKRYIAGSSMLSLEEFRAEFMGRQWGVIPVFYPSSDQDAADGGIGAAATDEMLALLMLHDVALFGDFANTQRVVEAYTNLDTFGILDATFIPYFAAPAPVQTGKQNVYASVYRRPDGHSLIVLANFNLSDQRASVRLNHKVFPTISKVESWTPAPVATLSPVNGAYEVIVPGPLKKGAPNPRTYKLLHVTP